MTLKSKLGVINFLETFNEKLIFVLILKHIAFQKNLKMDCCYILSAAWSVVS